MILYMKWTVAILLWVAASVSADAEMRWYAISSTQETTIVSFDPNGTLVWSNSVPGSTSEVFWSSVGGAFWAPLAAETPILSTGNYTSASLATDTWRMSRGVVMNSPVLMVGACWVIRIDGQAYEFWGGIPAEWQIHQLPVYVTWEPFDFVSICMNGRPALLYDIAPQDPSLLPIPEGMALIPSGSFLMGADTNINFLINNTPQRSVYVSTFYMDRHEVTKGLWDSVLSYALVHGYAFMHGQGKGPDHPVTNVTWHDAVRWCNARSEMDGLVPVYYTDPAFTHVHRVDAIDNVYPDWSANGYRLPTEAEWEKAARGGIENMRFPHVANTIWHWEANYKSVEGEPGDHSSTRGYHPTHAVDPMPYTSPVGSFRPNLYGLYDMAGNVDEWVWDWHVFNYYSVGPDINPKGPLTAQTSRIRRGGSWTTNASHLECAFRFFAWPGTTSKATGFRTVRGHL